MTPELSPAERQRRYFVDALRQCLGMDPLYTQLQASPYGVAIEFAPFGSDADRRPVVLCDTSAAPDLDSVTRRPWSRGMMWRQYRKAVQSGP